MSDLSTRNPAYRHGGRPVIGTLFGYQVFGIGLVYSYVDSIARGIQAAASDRDCSLLLACGMNLLDPPTLRSAWPEMMSDADFVPVGPWNTDGLIVVHPIRSPERTAYIRRLQSTGFPIVHVGSAEGGPAVDLDNESGIHAAVKHLAEHGHRRVAFIRGYPDDESGDSGKRLRAFKTAALQYGLEFDLRLMAFGYHEIIESQRAMQRIIASGAPFTAVVASNDESAFGAMEALTQAGLRVPQDVAVIGFDDLPESVHKLPPLTTVHHPVFERGYRALELLLDRIEGRSRPNEIIVEEPTHLVVRRSCGCKLEDILPIPATATDATPTRESVIVRLTHIVADAVFTETQYQNSAEMFQISKRLIDAFAVSLDAGDNRHFVRALRAVLGRVEQTRGSARAWMLVIAALRGAQEMRDLVRLTNAEPTLADALLHKAETAIDESIRRRQWHELYFNSEEHGRLAARLHEGLDEKQILRLLADTLPKFGIRNAGVALFESQGEDAGAWSVMHTIDDPESAPIRFRTREFPPPALARRFSGNFRLVLAPLLIQRRISGYMMFETENIELCANILHSVNTAFAAARMYREVVEGKRLAEDANRLKSRFLSTVSHELRTPLSLILSAADHLADDSGKALHPARLQQDVARIRAGAQHLDGLIRDVLDLTQDELGDLKLAREALNIAAALQPVLVVGEQLARAKSLAWHVEIPPRLPAVWADSARLRQVTLNLISNAVKFTHTGAVTLRVESEPHRLRISVTDTGLGIPPDEAGIIFDDFHQSTRTSTRGYGGLGLGLAICKRLVEMHAGDIGVVSSGEEGLGSTFYFSLPAIEVESAGVERSLARDKTALLLDDRAGSGEALHMHLVHRGFAVQRVCVDEPMTLLNSLTTYAPGVILVDAALAFGRGWELLRLLKTSGPTHDIPLLFYSFAQEENNNTAAVLQLDYLTKPVGTAELVRALQRQGIAEKTVGQKTVVIADDDANLLDVHAAIVQDQSKCRVLRAANGREAWAQIKEHLPDLVLLDLMMPEMDGFAVLDAMQKLETTRRIPVIVLTGQTLTSDEMNRLNRGVATILAKGVFSVEETLGRIDQTLSNRKPLNSEAQNLARKAMTYIHEHFAQPVVRKDIAEYVRVSEDHLTRYFQHALGIPPMTYLTRYRIQRAKAMLDGGEMNITRIAAAVGFSNEFYFSRVFRREIGITPSAYRRANARRA